MTFKSTFAQVIEFFPRSISVFPMFLPLESNYHVVKRLKAREVPESVLAENPSKELR